MNIKIQSKYIYDVFWPIFLGEYEKNIFGPNKTILLLKNHPKYAKIGVFTHYLDVIPKLIAIS